jgi:hypothetical protein
MMSRVRKSLGAELPLRVLFGRPTVRGFAAEVEKALSEGSVASVPGVEKRAGRGPQPLSFAQQRLWFMDQLEPGQATYNMPAAIRLDGELDLGALQRAVSEIVRRHEALRTRFELQGDEPVQIVEAAGEVELPVIDLRGMEEEAARRRAEELAREEASRPFDLGRGPMLRVKLIRRRAQEQVLLATMHHIACDGWSLGLMRKEFAALYEAYCQGGESPLEELAVQYADYAVWQRKWLQGEALESQLEYWRRQLGGMTVLELPGDYARPAAARHRGGAIGIELGGETSARLRALSRQEGVTLFMTLLAGFQLLLGRWTGQNDIAVGTDIANRNWKEVEETIGLFVNELVLRTDLSGSPTFRELLQRVREVTLAAYRRQDVPFERVVEELQPQRVLHRTPLFNVKLGLQNIPTLQQTSRIGSVSADIAADWVATVDVEIVIQNGASITGFLKYDTSVFRQETAAMLASGFTQVLTAASLDPAVRVSELRLKDEHDVAEGFAAEVRRIKSGLAQRA